MMIRVFLILSAISLSSLVNAMPVTINLNDFTADPTVTVSADGTSAVIAEDAMLFSVLLINDPFLGDPNVILADLGPELTFNFDFIEGSQNDDEFRVTLFDADTFDLLDEFFTDTSDMGDVAFDLSVFSSLVLGLQFELRSFDALFDSTVSISQVSLSNASAAVPEPSSLALLLAGCWALFASRYTSKH